MQRHSLRTLFLLALLLVVTYIALPPKGRQRFLLGTPGLIPCAVSVTLAAGLGSATAPSQDSQSWTVIATADGDTVTATTSHAVGANGVPEPSVTGLITAAQISLWVVTTLSTTQWAMTKATTATSGNASPQVRLRLQRPR